MTITKLLAFHENAISERKNETIETTSNLSSSNKEMILLQTAEVYVVKGTIRRLN